MKYIFLLSTLLLSKQFTYSQNLGVQWQKPFGGTGGESLYLLQKTSDQGYLMMGRNGSTDGDFAAYPNINVLVKINKAGYTEWIKAVPGPWGIKASLITENDELYVLGEHSGTGSHGGSDIWVCKINASGDVVWENFYGGTGNDVAGSFIIDANGDIVVVAGVNNATGNITGNYHGLRDIWIFKLNTSGTMLWNKCYGGSLSEFRDQALIKAIGSDYVILTETQSGNGDATGHIGSWDIWTFKINSSGILQWQLQLGGAEIEASNSIVEASSGGFYISGYSNSSTIPNAHSNTIEPDIYLARISSSGDFEWHKCYGGYSGDLPFALFAEDDGGCVLFANVTVINGNSGDITGFQGSYDEIWACKIAATQEIVWQRCIGGNGQDDLTAVMEEKYDDNNNLLPQDQRSYIIFGRTLSRTRDMTDFHQNPLVASQTQHFDIWLAKMHKNDRTLAWSRCLGGKYGEYPYALVKINSKEFLVGGTADSNDGDVIGQHGTMQDFPDAWIAKFGPANVIKGTVFLDMNANGIKDVGERYNDNAWVKSEKINDTKISVVSNGIFANDADTGTYTTSIISDLPYYISSIPSKQSVFIQYNQQDSFAFPLVPIPGHWDLRSFIIPLNAPRPNLIAQYRLICTNVGSEIAVSSTLKLIKDHHVNWVGSSLPPTSQVEDSITWSLPDLAPFETISVDVTLSVPAPPVAQQGDIIKSILSITSSHPEETPADNSDTLHQILIDSYDPNDKNESHGGRILQTTLQSGTWLDYVVRFQNNGTAAALNIKIIDTLDSQLDWSTVEMIASSHSYQLKIEDVNRLTWTFSNINLPDQNSDEPGSHGFIAYRIKPLQNLALGSIVENSASIYFDFNLPVMTNNVLTQVIDFAALPLTLLSFTGSYQHDKPVLRWTTTNEYNVHKFQIERSTNGTLFTPAGYKTAAGNNSITNYDWTDHENTGASVVYYRLKTIDVDGKGSYSKILLLRNDKQENGRIIFVSNPVTNQYAQVLITSASNTDVEIRVIDVQGRTMLKQRNKLYTGNNTITVNGLAALQNGIYLLQAIRRNEVKTVKFIKVR